MTARTLLANESEAQRYVEQLATDEALERLKRYIELLLAENARQNLISKASEADIWVRHIADSAQLLEHVPRETSQEDALGSWLDLGTGPGLPGLVVAILRPEIPMVLVESRARRVEFLEHCIGDLALPNCRVIGQRLERVESFPAWIISARAFAPLEKLLRLSAPFSTSATCYLLPKGRSAAHELQASKPAIRKMFHVKQSLTDAEAGIIVSA